MDRTRRIVLAAAGTGAAALVLLKQRVGARAAEPDDVVTVVHGVDTAAVTAPGGAAATSAEIAKWQAQVGQSVTLSGGGQRFDVSVAAVTAMPRPQPVTSQPLSWWQRWSAGARGTTFPPARSTVLPQGVRAESFSVLFQVESQAAPAADMLMELSRPIEGLRQVFVQPAAAIGGKARVIAFFG